MLSGGAQPISDKYTIFSTYLFFMFLHGGLPCLLSCAS